MEKETRPAKDIYTPETPAADIEAALELAKLITSLPPREQYMAMGYTQAMAGIAAIGATPTPQAV